jgi:hypothetical protein
MTIFGLTLPSAANNYLNQPVPKRTRADIML